MGIMDRVPGLGSQPEESNPVRLASRGPGTRELRALLPARLAHARDEAGEGHVPERDARQPELLQVGARPAGHLAPVADPRRRRVARHRAQGALRLLAGLLARLRVGDRLLQLAAPGRVARDDLLALVVLDDLARLRHGSS